MIVIRVELWSAIDGTRTELARAVISNTGEDSDGTGRAVKCNYDAATLRGRFAPDLMKATMALVTGTGSPATKRTKITNWRRHDFHVWNHVALALKQMGYDKGHPKP